MQDVHASFHIVWIVVYLVARELNLIGMLGLYWTEIFVLWMKHVGIVFSTHTHAVMFLIVLILLKILFMLFNLCHFLSIPSPYGLRVIHSLILHLDL